MLPLAWWRVCVPLLIIMIKIYCLVAVVSTVLTEVVQIAHHPFLSWTHQMNFLFCFFFIRNLLKIHLFFFKKFLLYFTLQKMHGPDSKCICTYWKAVIADSMWMLMASRKLIYDCHTLSLWHDNYSGFGLHL